MERDAAVSPIVGVVLMLAITILLAAIALAGLRSTDAPHGSRLPWQSDPPWDHPEDHKGAYISQDGHWCEPTLPGNPLSGYDCNLNVPANVRAPTGIQDQRPHP